jgi:hypothetical protein
MKKELVLLLLCLPIILRAGDPKYPVSAIPEELKKDVNAVIREDKTVYTILSLNSAHLYAHYVVTILNETGNHYAERSFFFDKLSKIKDLNAFCYDANGTQIKKLRNKDIYEQSAYDGFSLLTDDRFKHIDLSQSTYPYTVDIEYEMNYNYLFDFNGSTINSSTKSSVQHFEYKIIYPPTLKPRYKVLNIEDNHTVEKISDGTESVTWIYENIKPIKLESFGPSSEDLSLRILAAPSKFEYSGYPGDMSSWQEIGKWNLSLNKGRDVLTETTKQKIRDLTKNLSTAEEKTKALYEYLQSKTRYVSIQLGIGGFQPFEASTVDNTGYGDCKALSNYMVAMLKEVGVKGYYTTVMAGEDEAQVIEDFPSHQANHVIVAVPNKTDTIWLECTSQTNPFGYQGKFTGDRKALMITENGGVLVNTTRYNAAQNIQSTTAEVFVEVNGNAKAKAKTIYAGTQYENGGLYAVLDNQFDDQKKWIQKNTGIPSFDINSFSMKNVKNKIPSAIVNLDLNLNRLATVSGKRMFLIPNLMNRSTFVPEKIENRKTKVYLKMTFTDFDTIKYHIPEALYPEYLPEPVNIKSRFGEYESSYKYDQGSLIYIRRMKGLKGVFPLESYNELIDFYKNISKADNAKIVFLNKT